MQYGIAISLGLLGAACATAGDATDLFEAQVRPVLVKNCYACHTSARMGGLQLDSREHLMAGGTDGAVVLPGDPGKSLLIQAVMQTGKIKMPPQGKLTNREIEALSEWVRSGAIWPDSSRSKALPNAREFWSFQPVRKPALPVVRDSKWARSDTDRFVLSRLEAQSLRPVRPTDRRTLIRRANFDLIGLPPTPEEVDAFVNDPAPDAFAKVVDRLLKSPHYGERWGRYWLDLARYADGQLGASKDAPFTNAYRYRDWVIQAFNDDMPYDQFVKAQIAGDLVPTKDREKLVPGLGFYGLGPGDDDRVDVTGLVFLGLTTGCARCHDHKFDPIPARDYYSLLGVFKSTENFEYPLAETAAVSAYKAKKKEIDALKIAIEDFIQKQSTQLGELMARKTSRYMMAAWDAGHGVELSDLCAERGLDLQTLDRWVRYLKVTSRDHAFLKPWDDLMASGEKRELAQQAADQFESFVLTVFADKHGMDDRNYVKLGGEAGVRDEKTRQYTNLESLPIEKYYLWRDLASEPYKKDFFDFRGGVYYYGPRTIKRFLSIEWLEHYEALEAHLAQLERDLPKQYAFLHTIRDVDHPADIKIQIRGDESNLGEVAPRRFLSVLCNGEPKRFTAGSGRLELADAIANASNPLFARVMVNRIWQHHFGQGLVRTPSNFGRLGEPPSHPELLDYLAAKFVEQGWSIKAMHREIMLSAVYQLSTDEDEKDVAQDPANRLLWRANLRPRLDIEALRDSLLAVSGRLDLSMGGPATALEDENTRRTVYGLISRTKLDRTLSLFDFPNPNATSEQRTATVGPMQRLYFMNNSFVLDQAKALAAELADAGSENEARIARAYLLLYGRRPSASEVQLGVRFLDANRQDWTQYALAMLASSEFMSVN